ncbi:MAG: DUF6477 family protein [Pseudomonadota bacterium]
MFDLASDPTTNPTDLANMIRPRLLVRTARTGARMYRRARDLRGALPGVQESSAKAIINRLTEAEAKCEAARRAKAPGYRPAYHVQVLSALLAEAAQVNASGTASLRAAM